MDRVEVIPEDLEGTGGMDRVKVIPEDLEGTGRMDRVEVIPRGSGGHWGDGQS